MATPDFTEILYTSADHTRSRRKKLLVGIFFLIIIGGFVFFELPSEQTKNNLHFITEPVRRGTLTVTVSASGTLQPTTSVDVGSELSGTLEAVLVQENDQVRQGQILARLDPAKFNDQVIKSRAAVSVAEATVLQMEATVEEAEAYLKRLQQGTELTHGLIASEHDLDVAKAAQKRAAANLVGARATVVQERAVLKTDETNLAKTVIRSPVDGVVLTRKVEPGQTVVANMSIPVLFILAEDLTKMELQINVDEADVGNVQIGQPTSFTVAAWPGRKFPAALQRIGLGSTVTDNVVTYKTILTVQNQDLALRPGMTAMAEIITAQHSNILLVPNAALRFTPPAPESAEPEPSFLSKLLPRPPHEKRHRLPNHSDSTNPQIWILQNGQPTPISVQPGLTNGRDTEILESNLQPEQEVITDIQERA